MPTPRADEPQQQQPREVVMHQQQQPAVFVQSAQRLQRGAAIMRMVSSDSGRQPVCTLTKPFVCCEIVTVCV